MVGRCGGPISASTCRTSPRRWPRASARTTELHGEEKQAMNESRSSPKARLGIGLQSMSPPLAEKLGVDPRTRGAVVTTVREGSPAQEAGVREGDIVVEGDRKPVATGDEAVRLLSSERSGGHLLRVKRGDAALFLVIPSSQARSSLGLFPRRRS